MVSSPMGKKGDTMARAPAASGHLLRVLGLAFGLAVVVGGVVGQGILRTPGIVAGAVPDPTLILLLWAAVGVMMLIDACSWVEMGSSIPCTGGPYVLARRAFGEITGTVVGWADWMINILVLSFVSVVFSEYCQRLGIGGGWPPWTLSIGLIAACTAINWIGTRVSGASQTALSAAKGAALILLVIALFVIAPPDSTATSSAATAELPLSLTFAALLVAMSAVVNTYNGWTGNVYFGEEIVAPSRNIARGTFGGILLVIILYVAVNAALLNVLSPAEMAASKLPAAEAASRLFGPTGDTLITALSLLSLAAITNLYLMFTSRVGFAMARDGVLPRLLERTSTSGTPRPALLASALLAAAAAASGSYLELVAVAVPLTASIIALIDLGAIVMRVKEPDLPRPFKMPLFPLPSLIGIALNGSLTVALLIADPRHSAIGIGGAILLGTGYALGRRWRRTA